MTITGTWATVGVVICQSKCPVNLDHLQERYGIADSIKVQELEKEKRNEIVLSCLKIGTGLRQFSHRYNLQQLTR